MFTQSFSSLVNTHNLWLYSLVHTTVRIRISSLSLAQQAKLVPFARSLSFRCISPSVAMSSTKVSHTSFKTKVFQSFSSYLWYSHLPFSSTELHSQSLHSFTGTLQHTHSVQAKLELSLLRIGKAVHMCFSFISYRLHLLTPVGLLLN